MYLHFNYVHTDGDIVFPNLSVLYVMLKVSQYYKAGYLFTLLSARHTLFDRLPSLL